MRKIFQNIDIPRFDIKGIQEGVFNLRLYISSLEYNWNNLKGWFLFLLNNDDPDSKNTLSYLDAYFICNDYNRFASDSLTSDL